MDELFTRLATIAGQMNRQQKSPNPTLHFDMMAGALWWSDERPEFYSAEDHWCLRPVFRYRTSLICNAPDERFAAWWQEARKLFPQWPGFAADRCQPSDDLKAIYHRRNDEALISFELCDIGYRLQSEFEGHPPCDALSEVALRNDPPDITADRIHEIVRSSLRLAGKSIPENCWKVVQMCIADGLGVPVDDVRPDSWIVKSLGGD